MVPRDEEQSILLSPNPHFLPISDTPPESRIGKEAIRRAVPFTARKKRCVGAAGLHRITGDLRGGGGVESPAARPASALQQSQGGGDYSRASLCQAQYGSVSAPALNAVIVPSGATAPACGGTG